MLAIQKVILIKNQQNLRKLLKQTKVVVKRVLLEILKKIRINNVNRILIEHININSVSTKFDILPSMVKDNIQILTVLETKIDSFFPQTQFRIERYAPSFRYDRNSHGGGNFLFIRDIPEKVISITPFRSSPGGVL